MILSIIEGYNEKRRHWKACKNRSIYSEGYLETTSHTYAKEAVNKGHLVIVSVGKSRWTNGG